MNNARVTHSGDEQEQVEAVGARTEALKSLLREIAHDFQPAVFASRLRAEDQVLTDVIYRQSLPIEIFIVDTGRLPRETYELLFRLADCYGKRPIVYSPRRGSVGFYARTDHIPGFCESVEKPKASCPALEPLQRALAGKRAWITSLRTQQSLTRKAFRALEYDAANDRVRFNPLAHWSEQEVWTYIREHNVPCIRRTPGVTPV